MRKLTFENKQISYASKEVDVIIDKKKPLKIEAVTEKEFKKKAGINENYRKRASRPTRLSVQSNRRKREDNR